MVRKGWQWLQQQPRRRFRRYEELKEAYSPEACGSGEGTIELESSCGYDGEGGTMNALAIWMVILYGLGLSRELCFGLLSDCSHIEIEFCGLKSPSSDLKLAENCPTTAKADRHLEVFDSVGIFANEYPLVNTSRRGHTLK